MGKLCNFRGNKYQLPIGQMSNYGIAFNVKRKPENIGVNAIGSSIADVKLNYGVGVAGVAVAIPPAIRM